MNKELLIYESSVTAEVCILQSIISQSIIQAIDA